MNRRDATCCACHPTAPPTCRSGERRAEQQFLQRIPTAVKRDCGSPSITSARTRRAFGSRHRKVDHTSRVFRVPARSRTGRHRLDPAAAATHPAPAARCRRPLEAARSIAGHAARRTCGPAPNCPAPWPAPAVASGLMLASVTRRRVNPPSDTQLSTRRDAGRGATCKTPVVTGLSDGPLRRRPRNDHYVPPAARASGAGVPLRPPGPRPRRAPGCGGSPHRRRRASPSSGPAVTTRRPRLALGEAAPVVIGGTVLGMSAPPVPTASLLT